MATQITSSAVTLSWEPSFSQSPPPPPASSFYTTYELRVVSDTDTRYLSRASLQTLEKNPTTLASLKVGQGGGTTVRVTELFPSTSYWFTFRAHTRQGWGPFSSLLTMASVETLGTSVQVILFWSTCGRYEA